MWSNVKYGLVQPLKKGRTSPFVHNKFGVNQFNQKDTSTKSLTNISSKFSFNIFILN